MDENEKFFVDESIRHARQLSFKDCIKFLAGFIGAIGSTHPAAPRLRSAYESLLNSDQQLDLIQLGQLKLDLEEPKR